MTPETAIPVMLQWIGYQIGVDPGMISPTVQIPVWERLKEIDLNGLRAEPADYIGEFIHDNYPKAVAVASYIPHTSAVRAAERQAKLAKANVLHRILDQCGGSGGMMIALSQILDGNTIIYMAEPDVLSYRIALINAKLYNIPSRILNADYRTHDIGTDAINWRFAGMWTPPNWKYMQQAQAGK